MGGYRRREPVSCRRDGMRSIRLMSSRAGGRRRVALRHPAVLVDQHHAEAARAELLAQRAARRRVGVGQHDHVALAQLGHALLEQRELLDEARVVGGVGEDDERPGDPEQLVEARRCGRLVGSAIATAGVPAAAAAVRPRAQDEQGEADLAQSPWHPPLRPRDKHRRHGMREKGEGGCDERISTNGGRWRGAS